MIREREDRSCWQPGDPHELWTHGFASRSYNRFAFFEELGLSPAEKHWMCSVIKYLARKSGIVKSEKRNTEDGWLLFE